MLKLKKTVTETLYDLSPSQQTMYFMIKYSLHKQVIQIPTSFSVKKELDFRILAKAVNIEIARNDCLRLRFLKQDRQVKQYFLQKFELEKIRVLRFRDDKEQTEFFNADAEKPVKFFKDETFRICFFKNENGEQGVFFNVCHMVMDALAVSIFYKDLFEIYSALEKSQPLPAPLSSFEEHLSKEFAYLENKKKYSADAAFIREYHKRGGEPYYCGLHGKQLLEKQRIKKKNPALRVPAAYDPIHDRCEILHVRVEPQKAEKIFAFCRENNISPETLIQTGFRLYASALHDKINDTFMMVLCGRRVTKKEQHMGGCLAQPFMTRVILKNENSFMQTLNETSAVRTELFRHMNFPYLSSRKIQQEIYGYSAAQGPSFMMYTWLPLARLNVFGPDVKETFRGYNPGRYVMPLYAFSFVDPTDGGLDFYYMFRTNILKKEHIEALHKNALKAIDAGINAPETTVETLLELVSPGSEKR